VKRFWSAVLLSALICLSACGMQPESSPLALTGPVEGDVMRLEEAALPLLQGTWVDEEFGYTAEFTGSTLRLYDSEQVYYEGEVIVVDYLPDELDAVYIFNPATTDYRHPETLVAFTKMELTADCLWGYVPMLDYDVQLAKFVKQPAASY